MAVATTTAILIASAVAASAATYQAVEANQQKQAAKGAANAAQDQAQQLSDKQAAETKKANDLSTQNALMEAGRKRQAQIVNSQFGRGSTILTGGLGVQQPATTAGKSLLGQ